MIVGPPMIGFIADQVGMRLALAPVVILCFLAALCAPAARTAAVKESAPIQIPVATRKNA